MIPLQSKTNVLAPSVTYPYGNIKNDTGSGDGTPVDVQTYADIHQTMERIVAAAGITPNGLPDNFTNGFQIYDSIVRLIARAAVFDAGGVWQQAGSSGVYVNPGLSATGTVTVDPVDYLVNRYKVMGRTLIWQMQLRNITITGGPTVLSFLMPFGSWKFVALGMEIPATYNSTTSAIAITGIDGLGAISGIEQQMHLSKSGGAAFTPGTNNQSLAFSIIAEIAPV